jgi:hypothetical protein
VGVEKAGAPFPYSTGRFSFRQIQEKQKEAEMQVRRVLRQFPLVLVGALVFVTATLSAQEVRYNFMPGTDFSKFTPTNGSVSRVAHTPIRLLTLKSSSRLTRN